MRESSSPIQLLTENTVVYYFIPGDQDDMNFPNAFTIPHINQRSNIPVRLKDIKQCFPLPGDYHFRFKVNHNNSIIWLDLTHDDSVIPYFESQIVAKVLRVDWISSPNHSLLTNCQPAFQNMNKKNSSEAPAGQRCPDMLLLDDTTYSTTNEIKEEGRTSQKITWEADVNKKFFL